jgi:hypothetical protein
LEIEKSYYEQADLVKVVKLINGEVNSVSILPARKKRKQIYLAAGVNYSMIKYSGQNMITSEGLDNNGNSMYKNRKTSSFLPSIAVGTDVYFKPEIQKSYLKFEISAAGIASKVHSLFKYNIYTVEELRNTYQLSAVILSFCPQVIANFLNKENLKGYVGIGPCVNYLLPFKNEMYQKTNQQDPQYSDKQTDDYIRLKDLYASFMLRAGVTINKKIDISLCQSNPVELADYKASILSAKYTATQISVGYKFRQ